MGGDTLQEKTSSLQQILYNEVDRFLLVLGVRSFGKRRERALKKCGPGHRGFLIGSRYSTTRN